MVGIYTITNKINGKIYVGSSSNIEDREEYHFRVAFNNDSRHSTVPFYEDIRNFGRDQFDFKIVKQCSIERLEEEEQAQIDLIDADKLYNSRNVAKVKRGVESSQAKLNQSQIDEIISLLMTSKITGADIAKAYGVCNNVISEINLGKSYHKDEIDYPIRKKSVQISANRVFTDDEVRKYRKIYEENGHKIVAIMDEYNITVNKTTFQNMLRRKTYKDID